MHTINKQHTTRTTHSAYNTTRRTSTHRCVAAFFQRFPSPSKLLDADPEKVLEVEHNLHHTSTNHFYLLVLFAIVLYANLPYLKTFSTVMENYS